MAKNIQKEMMTCLGLLFMGMTVLLTGCQETKDMEQLVNELYITP